MRYQPLGQSGLSVSAVSMGCWALAGDATWGPQDEGQAIAAVHAALDCGMSTFDLAEGYGDGRSEELVGRALAGRRAQAIIATKALPDHLRPADLRASCEASLRRLRSDYIDLYYIHWPNRQVPIAETLATLADLRAEGKIRILGCSNFGRQDLTELLQHGRVEANELPYNLLWRGIEHEILPLCIEQGIGVTCYSPLAQGLLTGRFRSADEVPAGRSRTRHFRPDRPGSRHGEPGAEEETFATLAEIRRLCLAANLAMSQVAIAWLLGRPGVTSVIAGARNPAQVQSNAAAAELRLDEALVDQLTRVTEGLKERFGRNIDMWQAESRVR